MHGRVLTDTVRGDLHDIGESIVTFVLNINGFEGINFGISVPVAAFVEEIKAFKPSVVAA